MKPNTPTVAADYNTWERAEVERSNVEAAITAAESVKVGAKRLQRYRDPSAETSYPLEYAFHLLGDVRGQTVLDLGCGSGVNAVLLTARGAHVVGIDISTSLLGIGRQRAQETGVATPEFVAASAHHLPVASASVDVVFGIAILHHLDLELVSAEVHRVLRPGGRAIFQEPVRNSRLLQRIRNLIPYQAPDISPFEHPLTDEELDAFSRRFVIGRRRSFSLPHINLTAVIPVVKDHPHKLSLIDRALLKRFGALERFAGTRVFEVVRR